MGCRLDDGRLQDDRGICATLPILFLVVEAALTEQTESCFLL
jgi:hypothetical protein